MTMAEQGGGKGWRSSALTLPAQPPASWRTSERTFVWAAKLNLPPSCQGIGKAVRGEEKGERGGRSSGREGGREAGRQASKLSEPQLLRHCRLWKLAAPREAQPQPWTPKQGPGRQASGVWHQVPAALGPRLGSGPRSVPHGRVEVVREAEEEKFGAGKGGEPGGPTVGQPLGEGWGARAAALARSRPGCLHSWSVF